jgi:hypothetical protein
MSSTDNLVQTETICCHFDPSNGIVIVLVLKEI